MKMNCWEYKKCGREPNGKNVESLGICPATIEQNVDGINQGKNAGRLCWLVAGTLCEGEKQGTFAQKIESCLECEFFKTVSLEEKESLKLFSRNIAEHISADQIEKMYKQLILFHERTVEANRQLIIAEKQASIGHFAAGIAHDFNNILALCLSNSQLIQIDLKELLEESPPEINEYIEVIKDSVHRGSSIVKDLMAFAKPKKSEKKVTNLFTVIQNVIRLQKKQLETENIEIVIPEGIQWPSIMADQGQIEQVIMNLFINARHAIKPNGSGTIFIKSSINNNNCLLSIKDSGVGMDKKTKDQIFNPFFTTKSTSSLEGMGIKGTGLGLAVALMIINKHGGTIDVESQKGQGTTFTLSFPISSNSWDA